MKLIFPIVVLVLIGYNLHTGNILDAFICMSLGSTIELLQIRVALENGINIHHKSYKQNRTESNWK